MFFLDYFRSCIAVLFIIPTFLFAQENQLDTTFADLGRLQLNLTHPSEIISSAAIQANGKVVLAGFLDKSSFFNQLIVIRLHADGRLDETFGEGGVTAVSLNLGFPSRAYMPVVKLYNNEIIIGTTYLEGSNSRIAMVGLFDDGTLNVAFGENGIRLVNEPAFVGSTGDFLNDFLIKADGGMILSGMSFYNNANHFTLISIQNDGTLDLSFATNGISFTLVPDVGGLIKSTAFGEDGTILQGGYAVRSLPDVIQPVLVRYQSDGSLDEAFGINGVSIPEVNNQFDEISATELLQDGKLLITGKKIGSFSNYHLARLNQLGQLESDYGEDGLIPLAFFGPHITLASRDSTLFAYAFSNSSDLIINLDFEGNIDSTFGTNGMRSLPLSASGTYCNGCFQIDSNHNLIMGTSQLKGLGHDFWARRLLPDGQVDPSFGQQGISTLILEDFSEQLSAIAPLGDDHFISIGNARSLFRKGFLLNVFNDGTPDSLYFNDGVYVPALSENEVKERFRDLIKLNDGGFLVVGNRNEDSSSRDDFLVYKLQMDGRLDQSFGDGGKATIDYSFNDRGNAIAVQEDDKILIGGEHTFSLFENDFVVLRLHADGRIDSSFATNGFLVLDLDSLEVALDLVVSNDAIFAAGTVATEEGGSDLLLIKLDASGQYDISFGDNGILRFDSELVGQDIARKIRILPNDKILVGGQSHSNFALFQFLSDGSLDSSFGTNGVALLNAPDNAIIGNCLSIEILEDGRILAAGGFEFENEMLAPSVVRFLSNGTLDETFGLGGFILEEPASKWTSSSYWDILPLEEENFIAVGGLNNQILMAKYLNDLDVGVLKNKPISSNVLIYPNPLRGQANLKFELNEPTEIKIAISSIDGRIINTFSNGKMAVGKHSIPLNFSGVPSGTYFCLIKTDFGTTSIKVFVH